MPKGSPGNKKSPEHIQKLREAAKRRYASEQERSEQSERMKVLFKNTPSLQKMHSTESRKNQSASMKKLWNDAEYVSKIKELRNDHAYIQSVQTRMKELWADPIYRETMGNAMRNSRRSKYTSPEHLNDREWLVHENQTKTITQIAEEMGCSQSFLSGIFHEHGIIPVSHVVQYTGGEQRIIDYLHELGITNIERHNRQLITPYEIDIYLPDYKLGIEYHGVYWHSYDSIETTAQRYRHAKKYDMATAAGIRLLQFWDTEWEHAPDICKSIIARYVNMTTVIGARKCKIGVPTHAECREFLDSNHNQGYCPYVHAVGLYHNNELVMLLTIGKSRFSTHSWELLRMASKTHMTIIGGAQRLWAAITAHMTSGDVVISYADRRLFTGNVYTSMGFVSAHNTPPGYGYVLDGMIYSRLQFQKHKLSKMFQNFDSTLTEAQNMFANGYRRLWDAGQSVWLYTKP